MTFEENKIFIGSKPFMNYVSSIVMQFTTDEATEVVVSARGKFIQRAVDVSELVIRKLLDGSVKISDIKTSSEELTSSVGKKVRVSSIDIYLVRI